MKLYRDEKIKTAMDILLDLRNEFPACDSDAAKFRNMITSVRRILEWEHEEGVCGAFPPAVTWEPEPAVREPEVKTVRCCDCSMLEQYPGLDGKSVSRCGLFDISDVSPDADHKCEYFRASSPETSSEIFRNTCICCGVFVPSDSGFCRLKSSAPECDNCTEYLFGTCEYFVCRGCRQKQAAGGEK